MMEPTIAMSPHREHVHRLPSLNNLLESEVILGDDEGSSCDGEDSEMHSALEDLSETNTADLKFHDCSLTSSIADSAVLIEPDVQPDMSRLSLSQSYYKPEEEMSRLSLSQSYYKPDEPSITRSMLPRSSSTLSSRTSSSSRSRDQQRLMAPRSSYTDNTSSSKGRYSSPSPFATRRTVSVSGPHSQPTTPSTIRKPPSCSPSSSRPAVPPKPIGLTRQPSTLKAKTPESPMTPRRSSSVISTSTNSPAAKSFLASGKQPSVIRSNKPVTPTKPSTPPKRPDERFATLGRRPKLSSPVISMSMSGGTSMEITAAARETKATADKFATLPRRKPTKDRPCLPKPVREPEPVSSIRMDGGATLPRPMKKLSSPTLPGPIMKPRTVIYMEKSAQTEMSHKDVREGQEACHKLRSLSWQQQNNEEARQLERMLMQSKDEAELLQQELDEEREERQIVQRELEKTTQRVAAMLDSMEGVEREFHTRGDSLIHLETNLQTSSQTISVLQEQLEAQDAALIAQRLELDRSLQAEKALLQQIQESESENREMMDFLQAEKLALHEAVRDSESEMGLLKSQLADAQRLLLLKEEECQHLVRLAEQRRHELAALQAELKGAEGRTGSVLLAQGAQLSAAALDLVKLHSRMDGLLQIILQSHTLPRAELEALVFPNETFKEESSNISAELPNLIEFSTMSADLENDTNETETDNSQMPEQTQPIQRLVGSTSLQDLSDAINLTRRRPPEGREEPNPVIDEELRLAASLVDQIEETDHVLSKLLRVLRRLILDKDSTMHQLNDEREQLLASLNAQTVALLEAKEELNKLRKAGEEAEPLTMEKVVDLGSYRWNDLSARLDAQVCWSKSVSKVLETLPIDVLHAHPALQHLLQNLVSNVDEHDPNANGSG
ncbi:FYVE and coiled-coil domain-containing protein 1-like isoform X2 [Daphnia pulicaria]|nr:FYVE and coiled-coil domain-containing protein 1-like isoform X2 [Daphnia pulicaria]